MLQCNQTLSKLTKKIEIWSQKSKKRQNIVDFFIIDQFGQKKLLVVAISRDFLIFKLQFFLQSENWAPMRTQKES